MQTSRALFYAYCALIFCLPLPLGSNRDWIWLLEAALAFALLGVVAWRLARGVSQPTLALRAARPALWALGLWLAYGAWQVLPLPGGALSVDLGASLLTLVQSLFYATLFLLTLQLVASRRRLTVVMGVFVAAGLLQAAFGGLMTLSGAELTITGLKEHGRGVATGTFINRNHFAGFLELCLAVGLGRLVAQMTEDTAPVSWRGTLRHWTQLLLGPKTRTRLALVVMVIALVLSRSRMGNTAFFASLLIAGALALVAVRRPPRGLVILLLSLIAIDILIVGTWFGVERVVDRIQQTGTYDATTGRHRDEDRLDVDVETLTAWQQSRWTGTGGGTFQTVFPAYRPADLRNTFDHAHNDYLELLLEYGVIGVLPLAAFALASIWAAMTALRRRRDPLMRGAAFAVVMAGIASALHATVDFNLHIPANAAAFMVILGMAWVAHGARDQQPARHGILQNETKRYRQVLARVMQFRYALRASTGYARTTGPRRMWGRTTSALLGVALALGAGAQQAGMRAGNVSLYPTLGVSVGYDDNVSLNTGAGTESFFYQVSPGLRMEGGTQLSGLYAELTANYGRYTGSRQDNFLDYGLSAGWDYQPTLRSALSTQAGWSRSHHRRGEGLQEFLLPGQRREVDEYELKQLDLGYRYGAPGARGRLELSGGWSDLTYLNNRDITAVADHETTHFGVGFGLRLAPKTTGLLLLRHSEADFDEDVRDNDGNFYGLGLSWEATAKTTGRMELGYENKDYDSGFSYSGRSWEAAVEWRPREYSVFELGTGRTADEAYGASVLAIRERYEVSWRHQWRSRFGTVLDLGYATSELDPGAREDDVISYGASVNYQFRRWLLFGLGLKHFERDSSDGTFDYERNEIIFTAEIAP